MESVRQRPLDLRTRHTATHGAAAMWVAGIAVVLGLVTVTGAQAAGGASRPGKSLQPLLRSYPLDPGAGRVKGSTTTPGSVAPTPPNSGTDRPRSASDGAASSAVRVTAGVGAAALLAVIVVLLVIQSRRAPLLSAEGAQMAVFMRRNRSPRPDETSPGASEAPAPTDAGEVETSAGSAAAGTDRLAEPVAAVLQAADAAATRLTEATRREAEEIRRQAELEASARIEEARLEAEKLGAAAEQARAVALASSDQTRAEADAYAEERRLAAEREAAEIVAQGESEAATRRDALMHHSALLEKDAALAESRLRLLVGGLREVADRLDDLVGETTQEVARAEAAERDDGASDGAQADGDSPDESLTKTLQPKPERAGTR
jgi:hypothetical protein